MRLRIDNETNFVVILVLSQQRLRADVALHHLAILRTLPATASVFTLTRSGLETKPLPKPIRKPRIMSNVLPVSLSAAASPSTVSSATDSASVSASAPSFASAPSASVLSAVLPPAQAAQAAFAPTQAPTFESSEMDAPSRLATCPADEDDLRARPLPRAMICFDRDDALHALSALEHDEPLPSPLHVATPVVYRISMEAGAAFAASIVDSSSPIASVPSSPSAPVPQLVSRPAVPESPLLGPASANQVVPLPASSVDQPAIVRPPSNNDALLLPLDSMLPVSCALLAARQRADPDCVRFFDFIEHQHVPSLTPGAQREFLAQVDLMAIENGLLIRTTRQRQRLCSQFVVPADMVKSLLTLAHNDFGHLSPAKTLALLRERHWWPKMYTDVEHHCKLCRDCQVTKPSRLAAPRTRGLMPLRASRPMELLTMDFVTHLPVTDRGFDNLLVIVDHFSKYAWAFPMHSMTSVDVATMLFDRIFSEWGTPDFLLTDQGSDFNSELMKDFCRLFGAKKLRTSSYHPAGDGETERFNKTILGLLRNYCHHNVADWDLHLNTVLYALRAAPNRATLETPFFLQTGRDMRTPLDLLDAKTATDLVVANATVFRRQLVRRLGEAYDAAAKVHAAYREKMRTHFDDHAATPAIFEAGDLVWLFHPSPAPRSARKMLAKWQGPYRVLEKTSPVNYKLRVDARSGRNARRIKNVTVHVSRLKPFIGANINDPDLAVPDPVVVSQPADVELADLLPAFPPNMFLSDASHDDIKDSASAPANAMSELPDLASMPASSSSSPQRADSLLPPDLVVDPLLPSGTAASSSAIDVAIEPTAAPVSEPIPASQPSTSAVASLPELAAPPAAISVPCHDAVATAAADHPDASIDSTNDALAPAATSQSASARRRSSRPTHAPDWKPSKTF